MENERANELTIDIVISLAGIAALKKEWDEFYENSKTRNIFLTHLWNLLWLKNFPGEYSEIFVITIRKGGYLKAICPFVIKDDKYCGITVKIIKFIGGNESQYKGILAAEEEAYDYFKLIFSTVLDRKNKWDIAILDSIPQKSYEISLIKQICTEYSIRSLKSGETVCPYITLLSNKEKFKYSLKKSLRKNVNKKFNRMKRQGGFEFTRFDNSNISQEHLFIAKGIEGESWKNEEGIGIFSDDSKTKFHVDLVNSKDKIFSVDLAFLKFKNQEIAFQYGFVEHNYYYAFNTSYIKNFYSLSPGQCLLFFLTNSLADEQIEKLDLLTGGQAYKFDWATGFSINQGIFIFNRTVNGCLLYNFQLLKVWLKKSSLLMKIFKNKV